MHQKSLLFVALFVVTNIMLSRGFSLGRSVRGFVAGHSSLTMSATRTYKVAVAGAAGGIGQPLALLLKLDPNVKELSLFDVVRTPGVAADISHCCSPAQVKGFVGMDQANDALEGCDVVVIPAGEYTNPSKTKFQ
jgi:malate dehydrogenase